METISPTTNGRKTNGRKPGTQLTEPSTLVARLRAETGDKQEDFARRIGAGTATIRRYERLSIIPKNGKIRASLERAAKRAGVSLEAQAESEEMTS